MTLEVNGLVGGYSQVPVLKDISFTVNDRELVGLIGLNGAGTVSYTHLTLPTIYSV